LVKTTITLSVEEKLKRNMNLLCAILGIKISKLTSALWQQYFNEHKDKLSSITPDV